MPLHVVAHCCMPFYTAVCRCMLLHALACCMLLHTAACHCMLLTGCNSMPWHLFVCCCNPLHAVASLSMPAHTAALRCDMLSHTAVAYVAYRCTANGTSPCFAMPMGTVISRTNIRGALQGLCRLISMARENSIFGMDPHVTSLRASEGRAYGPVVPVQRLPAPSSSLGHSTLPSGPFFFEKGDDQDSPRG